MKKRLIRLTLIIVSSLMTAVGVSPVLNDNLQQTVKINVADNQSNSTAQIEQSKQVSQGSTPEKELVGEFKLTFYTPSPDETDDTPLITANGARVKPGITVAVDPRYWKLGTKFYIEGYGYVIAEDTGSKIKGPNTMDVCVETKDQALKNGIQFRNVWVVNA